jgi:hypothetical protein
MSDQATLSDYSTDDYHIEAEDGSIEYDADTGDITVSIDGKEVHIPSGYDGYIVLDGEGLRIDEEYDVETENRNGASPAYPTWRPECYLPAEACDLENEECPVVSEFAGSIKPVAKTHMGHRDSMYALGLRYCEGYTGWSSSREWEDFIHHFVYCFEDYGGAAVHADFLRVVCRYEMDDVTMIEEPYAEIVFDMRE